MTAVLEEITELEPATKTKPQKRLSAIVAPLIFIAGLIGIWYLVTEAVASRTSTLHQFNPSSTVSAFVHDLSTGSFYSNIEVSLERLVLGLLIALFAGVGIGLTVGSFRIADSATAPVFHFVRMISPVAWTPVAVILFGIGSTPAIALIALTALWPITINTSLGVRSLDEQWIQVARTFKASKTELLRYVLLPAISPSVLTGLRLALGIGWVMLVPLEMLGSSQGLGYAILNAKDALDYPQLLAYIFTVGILGTAMDGALRLLASALEKKRRT